MKKLSRILLSMMMGFSLFASNLISASALNVVSVDASSTIAKAFAFQPCVTEDTKITIDTSYNNFNQYYSASTSFNQPNSGDDYAYCVTLKQNADGSYMYSNAADRIMPSIRYIYENVGIYNGETVNARVTLSEIHDTYGITINTNTNERITDAKFDHMIFIDHGGIGFCAGRCHVVIEFLNEKNQPITDFKGNVTGTDLDSGQGVWNVKGVDTIYYKNNTIISSNGSGVQANSTAANGMYDENGQFLMVINSSSISFDWCTSMSSTASKWSEGRYISFQKAGFLKNETPGPAKEVDKKTAVVDGFNEKELLTYTISQYVPYQPIGYSYSANGTKVTGADYRYTKFVLNDTLPGNGTLDVNAIKVCNDAQEDVTNSFSYSLNGNVLTISAKTDVMNSEEFYAHTYLFSIPVSIDESTLSAYTAAKGTFVENNVNLVYSQLNGGTDVNGGSAKATTEFKYQIDSFHDEGSVITESQTGITGGDNREFNYAAKDGYYITSLKVDGKEVEYSNSNGSYTFGNITAYHTIEVTSQPYYHITTSVVNGIIDPSVYNIMAGKSQNIQYQANDGFYLESVTVDQKGVDLTSFEKAYNFANIKANHDIHVVYQPYLFIETEAVNGYISGNNSVTTDNVMKASYTNLKKGTSQNVTYEPKEGYYLDSIEVSSYTYDQNTQKWSIAETVTYSTYEEMKNIISQYNFKDMQTSYRIRVIYKINPTIMITKTVTGDYNLVNGIPTFMYCIKGKDYQGNAHTYYRMISFEDEVKNNILQTTSKTISDNTIPAGNYTITELEPFRYTLNEVKNIENITVEGTKAIADTMKNEICHVEFTNEQTNFKSYSHNDAVVNHIQ